MCRVNETAAWVATVRFPPLTRSVSDLNSVPISDDIIGYAVTLEGGWPARRATTPSAKRERHIGRRTDHIMVHMGYKKKLFLETLACKRVKTGDDRW